MKSDLRKPFFNLRQPGEHVTVTVVGSQVVLSVGSRPDIDEYETGEVFLSEAQAFELADALDRAATAVVA